MVIDCEIRKLAAPFSKVLTLTVKNELLDVKFPELELKLTECLHKLFSFKAAEVVLCCEIRKILPV